jgi:hypothetical protein
MIWTIYSVVSFIFAHLVFASFVYKAVFLKKNDKYEEVGGWVAGGAVLWIMGLIAAGVFLNLSLK